MHFTVVRGYRMHTEEISVCFGRQTFRSQSRLFWKKAKVLSELFEKDEGEYGVRAQTDERRDVALVEGQRTLLGSEDH